MLRFSADHFRGWCAAGRGEPRDENESNDWKEGHDLWHSKESCKRAWEGRPDSSVAVH